ncbi:hypothetical protein MMC29_004227 [Sticta canariensis]|nr:hypothetical protein [Sticta canariensis]
MFKAFKTILKSDPQDFEKRMISLASHNVVIGFPNLALPSTSLRPVPLEPRFSRSICLSPPSNTVSPAPGTKGLLALPASLLYRIVSFITRPCTVSRFCSGWTRRPVYRSALIAFTTTSIYLLLALQYHIHLPPEFLCRKLRPKKNYLPPKPCCEVDPKEAIRGIENMAAKTVAESAMEEHEMMAMKYYLGERKYYEGSYTLGQLVSALGARRPKEPKPQPAVPIHQWIENLPKP